MTLGVFLVFLAVVLSVYGSGHVYVLRRLRPVLPDRRGLRFALYAAVALLALSFLGGRMLERVHISVVSKALVWAGSVWMAVVVYAFLATLVCDLVRLAHRVRPFLPETLTPRRVVFGLGVVIALAVSAGAANAALVQTPVYDVPVGKRAGTLRELRVVVASDIHLGTVVGKQRFGRIVQAIQSLKPDVILLAGDVIDEDLAPVLAEDVGDHLRDLRAPFGVFAVTGNHEYIGGVDRAVAYLEEHGIRMLRDAAVEVAGAFTVVGRDDVSAERFGSPARRPLKEIMAKVDRTKPVLLLDHQPRDFGPALEEGVDLQVSGHTHHGQLWPFSLVTRAAYELSWGLERRGSTHFYVSCGAGTWGPPVRLGNSPEVVLLKLQFAP